MTHRAIISPEFQTVCEQMKMSTGIISGEHVFLSGVTGADAEGQMPSDHAQQIRNAFEKIETVLSVAGLTFGAVVEMTTYHVGLCAHFDLFSSIRSEFVEEPYPAWTAVEVAGLRREGAVVEIRVIASAEQGKPTFEG